MKILRLKSKNFYNDLNVILKNRSQNNLPKVDMKVKKIISNVILNGDKELFKYAKKFDNSLINKNNILISQEIRESYKKKVNYEILDAFS